MDVLFVLSLNLELLLVALGLWVFATCAGSLGRQGWCWCGREHSPSSHFLSFLAFLSDPQREV